MNPRPKEKWFYYFALLLPLLATIILVYGWPITADNDTFLHIKKGEWMIKTHSLISRDIFTYTARGEWDETAHSWLSQLLFAVIYSNAGLFGLRILAFLCTALSLSLAGGYVWRKTLSPTWTAFATSLLLLVHREFFVVRPVLIGECFFCLFLFYFVDELKAFQWKRLFSLSLLLLIWVNFHGGALVALPILTLYAVMAAFAYSKGNWKEISQYLLIPVGAGLVLMCNPLGPHLFSLALHVSELGRSIMVGEWIPYFPVYWSPDRSSAQFLIGADFKSILVLFSFVGCGACLVRLKKRFQWNSLYLLSLAIFFLISTIQANRGFLGFLFVVVYLSVEVWDWLSTRVALSKVQMGAVFGIFLFLLGFRFYETRLVVPSIEKTALFLRESGLKGNLYTSGDFGSYFIFSLYPEIKVSCDGRIWVTRKQWMEERQTEIENGKVDLSRLLAERPDTQILALPASRISAKTLVSADEWLLVFEDSSAVIFLKKGVLNQANLKTVAEYYRRQGISFDNNGFSLEKAAKQAPQWFHSHQDTLVAGLWYDPVLVEHYEIFSKYFYESRQVPTSL